MKKNQKIIFFGAIGIFVALIILIIVLIAQNSSKSSAADEAVAQLDSLALANDRLQLTNEFNQLSADFNQYEDQQKYLKNDSLIQQYDEARARVKSLLNQLEKERSNNNSNRAKIKQLEGEIATLKGIVKHYLEEIKRLGEENAGLKREIEQVQQRNQSLASENESAQRSNAELTQTVARARKLQITNLRLQAFKGNDKNEKNITKAKKLGVFFTVSPNVTAAPGMKDFYVRIKSPEDEVLGGGVGINAEGASISGTAHRQVEYANNEVSVAVYWPVNTTLTPGTYRVEVFCDGYRLDSRNFTMSK